MMFRLMLMMLLGISYFCFCETDNVVLEWQQLKDFNYDTKTMSSELKKHMNQTVEIAGFIVPLEMDEYIDRVREFFLVPDPLACIHVPPPPPNQMIFVRMSKSIPVDMDYRGVLIKGKLSVASQNIENQMVGFEMIGISAKEANIEYESPFDYLFEGLGEY